MNVLIVFATNSGGTGICAKIIKENLERSGHAATIIKALSVNPEDLNGRDLILFGTPTWFFGAKEGTPHEDILNLFKRFETTPFNNKLKYGVFGCGDRSYAFFCHAVDVVEEFLKSKGISTALESLKIDSFFFDMDKNIDQVDKWSEKLSKLSV